MATDMAAKTIIVEDYLFNLWTIVTEQHNNMQ